MLLLYEIFLNFQKSLYHHDIPEPFVTPSYFLSRVPLIIINICYQSEIVKQGDVDIKLEFVTSKNIPGKNSAYAFILGDKLLRYNPLNNLVRTL